MKKQLTHDNRLLKIHQLHLGLYARIGKRLGVSPSYVSRVANGQRENKRIMEALIGELRKLATSLLTLQI
jgi:transcriptional regulator with XRE-family HTH domain